MYDQHRHHPQHHPINHVVARESRESREILCKWCPGCPFLLPPFFVTFIFFWVTLIFMFHCIAFFLTVRNFLSASRFLSETISVRSPSPFNNCLPHSVLYYFWLTPLSFSSLSPPSSLTLSLSLSTVYFLVSFYIIFCLSRHRRSLLIDVFTLLNTCLFLKKKKVNRCVVVVVVVVVVGFFLHRSSSLFPICLLFLSLFPLC